MSIIHYVAIDGKIIYPLHKKGMSTKEVDNGKDQDIHPRGTRSQEGDVSQEKIPQSGEVEIPLRSYSIEASSSKVQEDRLIETGMYPYYD